MLVAQNLWAACEALALALLQLPETTIVAMFYMKERLQEFEVLLVTMARIEQGSGCYLYSAKSDLSTLLRSLIICEYTRLFRVQTEPVHRLKKSAAMRFDNSWQHPVPLTINVIVTARW